jgi:hypothetical protein
MDNFVYALFDRLGSEAGELSFRKDDRIEILERDPSGWCRGRMKHSIGVFPLSWTTGNSMLDEAGKVPKGISPALHMMNQEGKPIRHPLSSLQHPPYPDGVDAGSREMYLEDSVFFSLFGMDKSLFSLLPNNRKKAEKDKHGLS